jgi:esterase/lipase superfamily enzyme
MTSVSLKFCVGLTFALTLGGCSTLRGVRAPVPAAAPGTSQVDMLVATTRSPTESSEMFSGARANSRPVFAGSCFVGITPICKRTLAMNVTPCDWEKP